MRLLSQLRPLEFPEHPHEARGVQDPLEVVHAAHQGRRLAYGGSQRLTLNELQVDGYTWWVTINGSQRGAVCTPLLTPFPLRGRSKISASTLSPAIWGRSNQCAIGTGSLPMSNGPMLNLPYLCCILPLCERRGSKTRAMSASDLSESKRLVSGMHLFTASPLAARTDACVENVEME